MGRSRAEKARLRSHTLPSSPSRSFSSSSSSDFEFTICSSPHNNSSSSTALCPADELFYKGKLLPLHLSPRLSMVRTLLLASSSTSSASDTTTSASRDSTGSSSSSDLVMFADYNCGSSRPSSVADLEDEFVKRPLNAEPIGGHESVKKSSKYFSLSKFSSVFKKESRTSAEPTIHSHGAGSSSVKRMSASARDVFKKYMKKVKPLYEKLSQKQKMDGSTSSTSLVNPNQPKSHGSVVKDKNGIMPPHSFSGNLWFPRRKGVVSSCPSSMRSSPSHSGVLTRAGLPIPGGGRSSKDSSMEELQSAIQGAIAHCKNSMVQNRSCPLGSWSSKDVPGPVQPYSPSPAVAAVERLN